MSPPGKVDRIETALAALSGHESCCQLCPRECGVDRSRGEMGFCQTGHQAVVSHALLHYGEEPVISGSKECAGDEAGLGKLRSGSGTIFFAGCNLKCRFCQNYQLSWLHQGRVVGNEELARTILELEAGGALNINLVSPTHLLLPILRALREAYRRGLSIPLVYNSNGYEKADVVRRLDGIVDIYLPDLKYFSAEVAGRLSGAADYFRSSGPAIREMYCQRPALILDDADNAREGLIVRHLVLPGQTEDSMAVLEWLARSLSPAVPLSLMSQYHPSFQAPEEIRRTLRPEEYQKVLKQAQELGFDTMFIQPETFRPEEHLVPDFSLAEPFRWKETAGDKGT
jgi:putative pyruvate formate lyase activating enzyme